jgi:hypothetical protein
MEVPSGPADGGPGVHRAPMLQAALLVHGGQTKLNDPSHHPVKVHVLSGLGRTVSTHFLGGQNGFTLGHGPRLSHDESRSESPSLHGSLPPARVCGASSHGVGPCEPIVTGHSNSTDPATFKLLYGHSDSDFTATLLYGLRTQQLTDTAEAAPLCILAPSPQQLVGHTAQPLAHKTVEQLLARTAQRSSFADMATALRTRICQRRRFARSRPGAQGARSVEAFGPASGLLCHGPRGWQSCGAA